MKRPKGESRLGGGGGTSPEENSYIINVKVGRVIQHSKGLCIYPRYFRQQIAIIVCHSYVQGTPKCKIIGALNTTALQPYSTSEDYQTVFPKLLTMYATRQYGVWARSLPFCYFEKSLKVEQLPKALGALSEIQTYTMLYII